MVKLLQTVMQEKEEDQKSAGALLTKCFKEKIMTKENITKVCITWLWLDL